MTLLHMMSASRAATEIAAGRLTSIDLFNACTQQITRHNPAAIAMGKLRPPAYLMIDDQPLSYIESRRFR